MIDVTQMHTGQSLAFHDCMEYQVACADQCMIAANIAMAFVWSFMWHENPTDVDSKCPLVRISDQDDAESNSSQS